MVMGTRYRPPKPSQSPYITKAGAEKMREELNHLWKVERPRVTHEVSVAAAHGDRSENAEYIYGKKRLREIDGRLRFLAKRLEVLNVVEPKDRGDDKVYFGAWVTVEDDDGEEKEYRIVGPDESDFKNLMVSMDSPMGKALLGKSNGDEIKVKRPKGDGIFVIVNIRY